MDNLPIAMLIAQGAVSREVTSAFPDAPVVPYVAPARRRPRTFRARAALAGAFQRAADAVAPCEEGSSCPGKSAKRVFAPMSRASTTD